MSNLKTYLLLTGSAAFWGANFVVGKFAVGVMAPLTVGAWRFILAATCMSIILYLKERPTWQSIHACLPMYALLGAIGIFGFNALLFIGLKLTSPVNASLVMATNPLVTAILASLLLRESLRPWQAVGIAVSLTGVLFVLTSGTLVALRSISSGDLLVFGGNVCWALYAILGRKYVRGSTPLALSTLTMIAGAVCFLPFAPIGHITASSHVMVGAWAAITFMAVCGSVLAYVWWVQGVARIGASKTAMFFNLVPVSTLAITAASGGHITPVQALGALLVLAGVSLANVPRPTASRGTATPERRAVWDAFRSREAHQCGGCPSSVHE